MTLPLSSYDWLREIKPNLKKLDSIPLTGATPPFPWEELSAQLGRAFDVEGLTIQPGEIAWRAKEDLYENLGDSLVSLTFSIPSLQGQVYWIIPTHAVPVLTSLLLTKESHPIQDQALNESFYQFLTLEVLYDLTQVSFDPILSPILTGHTQLPNEDSLCWDISFRLQNQTILGRLLISPEFRHSWVEYFAQKQGVSPLNQQMAQLVNVTVHLEAGKTQLTLAEWKSVQLGDFVILDKCSLEPEKFDGRVMLTINGKQAFRAKLKNGSLKILELPLLHEVETPMAKQPENEQPENDDDFDDLDLPEEELEDEDLFSDTDDLFTEEEIQEEAPSEGEIPPSAEPATQAPAVSTREPENLGSPEQIPITLTVEVGQVKMSMEQLLKLEPGNLLEIDIYPENGVDLTVNGRVIGKGELIRIGDAIGVRVVQLGH